MKQPSPASPARRHSFGLFLCLAVLLVSCTTAPTEPTPQAGSATQPAIDRQTKIPASAVKMSPATDPSPPQSLLPGYAQPVPVPGLVNTAGAEDSPFILPSGDTLYFFFTPDVKIPAEQQLLDGVTGLYVSRLVDGQWAAAERVLLQDPGKVALDGCEFVLGDAMWFCSAREGYTDIHWFTANYLDGRWQNWQNADFPSAFQVGELHISSDGYGLYYHSERPGGQGGLDIWYSGQLDGIWQEPFPITVVNSPDSEGWPALSPDGTELWFYRNYAIWRSLRVNGQWQSPEQAFSPLAGEPTIDSAGNVYFVHHFFQDNLMLEADLYVAYKQ